MEFFKTLKEGLCKQYREQKNEKGVSSFGEKVSLEKGISRHYGKTIIAIHHILSI